jgi:hypothetical protein
LQPDSSVETWSADKVAEFLEENGFGEVQSFLGK